jgi:DNA-binding NtrC family response regulator
MRQIAGPDRMARVLVVDARAENRHWLAELLTNAGHEGQGAADVLEAVTRLRVTPVDVVLANVRMEADDDGLKLLRIIKGELSHIAVILYAAFPRTADAVLAMKLGAEDYLEFPADRGQMLLAIAHAVERQRHWRAALDPMGPIPSCRHGIVGESPAMRAVLDWIDRIGPKDLTVLLVGETGTERSLSQTPCIPRATGARVHSFQ